MAPMSVPFSLSRSPYAANSAFLPPRVLDVELLIEDPAGRLDIVGLGRWLHRSECCPLPDSGQAYFLSEVVGNVGLPSLAR